ncbi:MAG: MgtC/SapB family protein [Candidatus Diapherotrites archaeon]
MIELIDLALNSDILFKLVLAAVIGVILGFEREIRGREAGIRTHALVCIGAALLSVVSFSFINDSTRIAAGIVTGVGFLGAGAIFKAQDHVSGLTTAADLWVAAAIGLAIGLNQIEAALIAFALVIIILVIKPKAIMKLKK